jgi:hypothetical protein
MAGNWSVWARFEAALSDYAAVLAEVRQEGLPDALAAIPFQESGYRAEPTSPVCARGWWQFMPETGARAGLRIEGCQIAGSSVPFTPAPTAPPVNAYRNAPYVSYNSESDSSRCLITRCDTDERTDRRRSTEAAVELLAEAYGDAVLRGSGAIVPIVIASHNAGYDDTLRRNFRSTTQLKPAWEEYHKKVGRDRTPEFYGAMLTCRSPPPDAPAGSKTCGGYLWRETQNYVPIILAYQLLAVCYYGKSYGDDYPVLHDYADYTVGNGYCTRLNVPTPDEVRAHRKAP